jgi:hypothetical protein
VAAHPPTPHEEPFSESHLGSPEYRERLMRKLNCLIAVLEVATAKVRKNMAGSPPDSERLARICANLESTLEVCQRARTALKRRNGSSPQPARPAAADRKDDRAPDRVIVPAPPARTPKTPVKPKPSPKKSRRRVLTDLSTDAERKKFEKLPPIDRRSIRSCDLDDLARRLCS